jgi:hypothetical protein
MAMAASFLTSIDRALPLVSARTSFFQRRSRGAKTHAYDDFKISPRNQHAFMRGVASADDESALNQGILTLNGKGSTSYGRPVVLAAISVQTKVPINTLRAQRASTRLSYSELLVADSLASGNGKSLDDILALRAKGQSWGQIANQYHINIGSIIARLDAASDSMRFAESRRDEARRLNLHDVAMDAPPTRVPGM